MRRRAVVFCGGGPAALGPVVRAAADGRLDDLLDAGVTVVEPVRLGPGSIGHYGLTANSLGGAFLECLDRLDHPAFAGLTGDPTTAELRRWAHEHPPLPVVAAFLARLGDAVAALLREHPGCDVHLGARVTSVRLSGDGGVLVGANGPSGLLAIPAERAVLAMGGTPLPLADTQVGGRSLSPHAAKLCAAAALFDDREAVDEALVQAVRRTGQAVVVGAAHSAWSAALVLRGDPRFRSDAGDPPVVTLLHRGPVRVFYLSADAARADGYRFDPFLDVCPLSGRVHRFGGVRGDAAALARRTLRDPDGPVRLRLAGGDVGELLEAAGMVVVATGYGARLPELAYADGSPLVPLAGPTGLAVDEFARVRDQRGEPVPQLLAYGLGAGLTVSADVGGEPGYERRADGVWLYQHDIGRIVLRGLLDVPAAVAS